MNFNKAHKNLKNQFNVIYLVTNLSKLSANKILILFVVMFFAVSALNAQPREVRKKIAKAEKVEAKQKKLEAKELKQKRKDHMSRQTKKTRSRMKDTDKKAAKFNKQTDKSFFNRLFDKRNKKARKKYG